MIRYLEAEEKGRTRALWNEAFPEDSVSFGDYYYKEKTKDNRILVCEEEGRIVAMLQRNPYAVSMRGDVRTCDYIVGVATAVSERHKGHMRSLLLTMLRDMQEERMPFAFTEDCAGLFYLCCRCKKEGRNSDERGRASAWGHRSG